MHTPCSIQPAQMVLVLIFKLRLPATNGQCPWGAGMYVVFWWCSMRVCMCMYVYTYAGMYASMCVSVHVCMCAPCCSAVEGLPGTQAPEVYGLAGNADTSRELTATSDLLASLLATGEQQPTLHYPTLPWGW